MSSTGVGLLLTGLGVPLFAIGATLLLWLMRSPWRRVKRNMRGGGVVEGVVVDYEGRGTNRYGKPLRSLVVEYRSQTNEAFRMVSSMAATSPKPVGTRLRVAYDVSNPAVGVLVGGARTLATVGSLLSILCTGFSGVCAAVFVLLLLVY